MVTLLKLGGSLITDKRQERAFRREVAVRIAAEIAEAIEQDPSIRLLIGHGSGSFGHVVANRFKTIQGVSTRDEWRGYAQVANVASELNHLLTQVLQSSGLPVLRIQPSASLRAQDGRVLSMELVPLRAALHHGLIPLVHGDVALDDTRGGTIISTEALFFYLTAHLEVDRIVLVGEVDGVYDIDGVVIPRITSDNIAALEEAIGGSSGIDVTGGMETKVRDMLALVADRPNLHIRIIGGLSLGVVRDELLGRFADGTTLAHR